MTKDTEQKILVTGGTGYIGSHICVELLNHGRKIVVVDNLCNSSAAVIDTIIEITEAAENDIAFYQVDLRDRQAVKMVFREQSIQAVIHLAGLKSVGESVEKPLLYFDNNVGSSIALFQEMQEAGVKTIIFSSSATVYGVPPSPRILEEFPKCPVNPYGWSKRMIEQILLDLHASGPEWKIASLRYFNPAGAHESGRIGESPKELPNNLFPLTMQVAVGLRDMLRVFGKDYDTRDGTGERDYIHVTDLATGHIAALDHLVRQSIPADPLVLNLGTGESHTVLEVLQAFEQACGLKIPYAVVSRRQGDIARYFADPYRAEAILGWKAKRDLQRMCDDAWRWQKNNPNGFDASASNLDTAKKS